MVLAQDRARALKSPDIGTEHVLLGLIGEPDGIAGKVLVLLVGSLDKVSEAVTARLTPGDTKPSGHLPLTEDAKQVLIETTNSALNLGHNYIGTEHMLLGLLRVPDSLAAQVLGELGVQHDRVQDAVNAMLVGYRHQTGK